MLESLNHLAISPSGFVFDPTTGATFTTNETGRRLLEGLRDGLDLEGLVASLSDRFQVQGADLRRDIFEYLRVLQDEQLIPRDFDLH